MAPIWVGADEGSTGSGVIVGDDSSLSAEAMAKVDESSESSHPSHSSHSSLAPVPVPNPPPLVRISEFAWMGSDLSTADEWLEIAGVAPIDGGETSRQTMQDWTISIMKDTGETVIARFATGSSIGAGEYQVISHFAAAQSRLLREPALVAGAITLPNTKLQVRLRDAAGMLVDEADDYIGVPFAGLNPSDGIKASMERIDLHVPGTIKENWRSATTSRGLDAVSTMLATPGYENGSIQPPDITPPHDVTKLRAYAVSGSLLLQWQVSISDDVSMQNIVVQGSSMNTIIERTLSSTGASLILQMSPDALDDVTVWHQVRDTTGYASTGVLLSVQPLYKPIINELLPNPIGSDDAEWIELMNSYDEVLDLRGFVLQRGTTKYTLPSMTGSILLPRGTLLLPASVSKLTLPNTGGEVTLSFLGVVVDRLTYSEVPEGVSVGRIDQVQLPLCSPTPGGVNASVPPALTIDGLVSQGMDPVTVNLEATAVIGTLKGGSCTWDFGDGYTYVGCNPPAHTMRAEGDRVITVKVTDYCGNTVVHSSTIKVLQKPNAVTGLADKTPACTSTTMSGITISEFLPNPIGDEEQGEWIELQNTSGRTADLCGWSVDDAAGGSSPFALDAVRMEPGEHLVLPRRQTKIALNNDKDAVRLIAPLAGGGTGVFLHVPYQAAPNDESFALREDGHWLWTQFATPGIQNRFRSIDLSLAPSPVILSAALPDPIGKDEWDEWVELTNVTNLPQWLNGWVLKRESGQSYALDGIALGKRETMRLRLRRTGLSLRNSDDVLQLIDDTGAIRSVLAWEKAKMGKAVRRTESERETPVRLALKADATMEGIFHEDGGYVRRPFSLEGISFVTPEFSSSLYYEIQNFISALIQNKKIELEMYSDKTGFVILDGTDMQALLLRMGYAYVRGGDVFDRKPEYRAYEREAAREVRGLWAADSAAETVAMLRATEDRDAILAREGLRLDVPDDDTLFEPGSLISAKTNVDADLYVSYGSGAPIRFAGTIALHTNEPVTFYARLEENGSGTGLTGGKWSTVVTRFYNLKRERYSSCIVVSEVYPSPRNAEPEWLELYNKCDQRISLLAWSLDDEEGGGSKPMRIGSGVVIAAHEFKVFSGSGLKLILNNGGDAVTMRDPLGKVHSSVIFPSLKKGRGIALLNESYCLTDEITPGMLNICKILAPTTKSLTKKAVPKAVEIGVKTTYAALLNEIAMSNSGTQILSHLSGLMTNRFNNENGTVLTSDSLLIPLLCIGLILLVITLIKRRRNVDKCVKRGL